MKQSTKIAALLLVLVLFVLNISILPRAFASTYLTHATVAFTNMDGGASQTSSLVVAFTTSGSNTGTNGSLAFSGWNASVSSTTGVVAASQTVSNTLSGVNCKTLTGASSNLPGSPTAAGTASTGTIAITDATALTASTSYCYVLTGASVTNPTGATTGTVALTAGSDSATNVGIDFIANDQVVVSATVPPSFTMALSSNTDSFTANLASGSVTGTNGITVTVNTNANSGWFLWGSDSSTGLHSATVSHTIASTTPGTNATLSAGTEGYVSSLPASGITQGSGSAGTTSATTAYASSGSGNGSGLTSANQNEMASSTGTANGAIVTIKEYAAISGVTPAATDYSDTITLVGAGSF